MYMRALMAMVLRPRPKRIAKISPNRNDLGVMTCDTMMVIIRQRSFFNGMRRNVCFESPVDEWQEEVQSDLIRKLG